jgi:hypothetical protein
VSCVEHKDRDVENWFVLSINRRNDQMSAGLFEKGDSNRGLHRTLSQTPELQANIGCLLTSSARQDSRSKSRSVVRRKQHQAISARKCFLMLRYVGISLLARRFPSCTQIFSSSQEEHPH